MAYIFFYSSIALLLALFFIISLIKRPKVPNILIGLTTVGYSLISDILFGDQLKLFYYINPLASTLYMVISAVVIYPILNVLYTMFLPCRGKKALTYTIAWIAALLLFEYGSVAAKTIVFTGWKPVPWSFVTYIVAYLWIYYFYRYLTKRVPEKN